MSKIQLKAPRQATLTVEEVIPVKKSVPHMRWLTLLVFCCFAGLGVCIFVVLQALFLDNAAPIVYQRAVASPPVVEAGKSLYLQMHVIRYRTDCTGVASRWVIDSTGTRFAITDFSLEAEIELGEHDVARTIKIPDIAAPGPAKYKLAVNYYCNWTHRIFKPIVVGAPLVRFTILPPTVPTIDDSTTELNEQ